MKIPELRGLRVLFEVGRRSIKKYLRHNMTEYSAALSYRALFALFPFFALLVLLMGILGINGLFDWLIDSVRSVLQEQYANFGEQAIGQIQSQTQSGFLSFSIVSFGIALWSVSSGVRSLTKALNAVHEVVESRPSWKRYPLSFFYALSLAITTILGTFLLLIGPEVVERIAGLVGLDDIFVSLWTWLRLPVALFLLMLTVSIIYWALPNVHQPYRLVTPGAVLAVITWVVASLGFSFYLENFANYSVIYGALGIAFALLLYFYISAAVLLMGAELNAAIHYYTSGSNAQGD